MRGVVSFVTALAVAAGCSAFDAEYVAPPAMPDAGPASTSDASTSDASSDAAADSGAACPATLRDDFERSTPLGGPWRQLFQDGKAVVRVVDGHLAIETKAEGAGELDMLTTGRFAVPRRIECSFGFKPNTEFDSTNGVSPIDLFVYSLWYADGSRTLVRYSYSQDQISVREDLADANGSCLEAQCPLGNAVATLPLPKYDSVTVSLAVDAKAADFAVKGVNGRRELQLGTPIAAEIYFGLWSYSDYGQDAELDNLSCQLVCP